MDRLIAMSRNPIPTGAVAGRLIASDGVGLRYARWPAALKEWKGTVCLFGGRTEFIEKYFETVTDLRRRGFAVATMDWRGQGGSDRPLAEPRKGHVEDFAQYVADIGVFMRDIVLPDCPPPYFALGHSMGGAILLLSARGKDSLFDRMVLSAPMIGLNALPLGQDALWAITEVAVYCGLGDFYVPGQGRGADKAKEESAESSLLTSDPQRLARNLAIIRSAPELALGAPTLGWLRAALAAIRLLQSDSFPSTVTVPVLMVAAGGDRIVSNQAIEHMSRGLKAGAQIVIRGARHELLQERGIFRDQFWAAVDAFLPGSKLEFSRQAAPAH